MGAGSAGPTTTIWAIFVTGLLGSLLLFVAEFTTLYQVRTGASRPPLQSVGTGSHHTYALVPIALLAAFLSFAVFRVSSRPALLCIGLLSVIALLIALLGDLPDAHASGLIGGGAQRYAAASSTPSAGFYMETLGGVVLLITCVCGFLLLGAPRRRSGAPERSAEPLG